MKKWWVCLLCIGQISCVGGIYEEDGIISKRVSDNKNYKYIYTVKDRTVSTFTSTIDIYSNKEYKLGDVITFIPREKVKEVK